MSAPGRKDEPGGRRGVRVCSRRVTGSLLWGQNGLFAVHRYQVRSVAQSTRMPQRGVEGERCKASRLHREAAVVLRRRRPRRSQNAIAMLSRFQAMPLRRRRDRSRSGRRSRLTSSRRSPCRRRSPRLRSGDFRRQTRPSQEDLHARARRSFSGAYILVTCGGTHEQHGHPLPTLSRRAATARTS